MNQIAIIKQYIAENIMRVDKDTGIPRDKSLFNEGILDSLTLLELISFIEEEFAVTIEDSEVSLENFETLDAMDALLQRKLKDIDGHI